MIIFDGPGDTYDIMLSDGVNIHYYDLIAKNEASAIELASQMFKDKYGVKHTEVKLNCTGLLLTRNY